ncbi:hypothetical protein, partial [Kitasatospora sp. NPDC057015]|uniref:hypothetical protein n=1 Tax=Kitasatospora sp. NPDC057015 TaxID=3346001 RepID=UPI0036376B89
MGLILLFAFILSSAEVILSNSIVAKDALRTGRRPSCNEISTIFLNSLTSACIRIGNAAGKHQELIPDGKLCSANDPAF